MFMFMFADRYKNIHVSPCFNEDENPSSAPTDSNTSIDPLISGLILYSPLKTTWS